MSKLKIIIILAVVLTAGVFLFLKFNPKTESAEVFKEIKPILGSIQSVISTTGLVLPKNRIEIKPPVSGRVESISVKEGDKVKDGQVLGLMSSTERAALLDAAQGQGQEQLKYWQEAYKPITLLAPIEGEVIVATVQPGQIVTTADAVVVLSDQLIVRAQVDETDIGRVKLDQKAEVTLDAYPDTKINARVEHIYYESKTVNNVTIYEVDLIPENVPVFFRSGMNATINFQESSKPDALTLPLEAIHREKNENYVLVKDAVGGEPVKRLVKLGLSDDKSVEIISGITANDQVIDKSKKAVASKENKGSNPFNPFGNRKGQPAKK